MLVGLVMIASQIPSDRQKSNKRWESDLVVYLYVLPYLWLEH